MIKGPGKNALINNRRKNIEKLVEKTGLYINLNNFINHRNKKFNYTIWNQEKLAGFAILKPENKTLELELIVTNTGKGFGTQLLNRIKNNSKNKFNTINLVSLPKAMPFYKRHGFTSKNIHYPSAFTYNLKKHV